MTERRRVEGARSGKPCVVVGAGLAGSLMSVFLARRGFEVEVFERRADMRQGVAAGGRSINLALSTRGLQALSRVGMARAITSLAIPMSGRMIHAVDGGLDFQPYGKQGQAILSVSRQALNEVLMDLAEAEAGVNFHFEHKCVDVNLSTGQAVVRDLRDGEVREVDGQVLLGADGAFSKVRRRIQRTPGFNYEQAFLGHAYKELTIPATSSGGFALSPNALHIWPRRDFMLIALPNLDRSFTCTLCLSKRGEMSFEALSSPEDVLQFFLHWFPDAQALMPTLLEDYFGNPTGDLVTIRCDPYQVGGRVGLIGDAAHAVVPFFGQGMNASFEDCAIMDELIARHGADWPRVLSAFSAARKPALDALADLSLANYTQMRSEVRSPLYKARKKLDLFLYERLPEGTFVPLYNMVTFSTMPYDEAVARAARQDRWITAGLGLGAAALGGAGYYLWRRHRR